MAVISFVLIFVFIANISLVNKKLNDVNAKQIKQINDLEIVMSENEKEIILLNDIIRTQEEEKLNSNGKMVYLGKFEASFYCPCSKCCGKSDGITASGVKAVDGITIAADTNKIPIGSYVYIDGIGCRIVQDKGGAIKGNKLDIYVNTHEKALKLGRLKNIDVWVIN